MGQDFGGEAFLGRGGASDELEPHVIFQLVVKWVGIAGEGEEDGLEQVSQAVDELSSVGVMFEEG